MDEFEIFLNPDGHDSSLQDVVCLPPSSTRTAAQRRWHLMRNMALAQYKMRRLTSLTDNEKHLLEALASKESLPDSALCAARHSLRSSIHTKASASNLTPAEVDFLHRLIETPQISADQLEKVQTVLLKDPLYASEIEHRDASNIPRHSEARRDAPFRTELWDHCYSGEPGSFYSYKFQGETQDSDSPVIFTVLGAPDPCCQPHVLSPPIMDALRPHMPFAVQQDNYWLKYSMMRDGSSLRSLLHKCRGSARTIVAIETVDGRVIGSFTSSPWRPRGNDYYGSGEAFLWRTSKSRNVSCETAQEQALLERDVEFFEWSGENRYIQRLVNAQGDLILGGGEPDENPSQQQGYGPGLILSSCLSRGFSHSCLTFNSPELAGDAFEIANLEVWTLTPVETLDQAEKVELGRQFVFDHGSFVMD
jgi:hypothetical protein